MKNRRNLTRKMMLPAVSVLMTFSPVSHVFCLQGQNALNAAHDAVGRAELAEDSGRAEKVPFPAASRELPFVADAMISSRVQETVAGLKSAHYTIDEIAAVLKQDNHPAFEISIALLNNNYSGPAIHAALLKAGFPERAADAAVPVALRREGQLFPVKKTEGKSAAPLRIRPNPLAGNESEPSRLLSARERVALVLAESPAAVADWRTLFGSQFKQPLDQAAMDTGTALVKTMLREGYTLVQVVQGFAENKYEAYQIAVMLGLAGISPEIINRAMTQLK